MFERIRDDGIEHCGMLLGIPETATGIRTFPKQHLRVVEVPNRHEKPEESYRIFLSDIQRALHARNANMSDIVGFWHSHPSPFLPGPSQADLDSIALGETTWWHAVFHPATRTITWYDYFDNVFEEIDNGISNVRRKRSTRVGRVRGPRKPR